MEPMGSFCFVVLILRNPLMQIGEIIGICVAQWVLTMHVLAFGEPPQFQFSATFFTTFVIGGLLLQNWEKYGKCKTIAFIIDYLAIYHPKFGGGRLNRHGETFTQIGVRQIIVR